MDLDILPRSVRYRLKDVIDEVRLPSFSTFKIYFHFHYNGSRPYTLELDSTLHHPADGTWLMACSSLKDQDDLTQSCCQCPNCLVAGVVACHMSVWKQLCCPRTKGGNTVLQGRINKTDIDARMLKALADLPVDLGIEAIDKFAMASLDSIRSKTGFMVSFCSYFQNDLNDLMNLLISTAHREAICVHVDASELCCKI